MAVPRQEEAQEYLAKQRIMELFDNITAQLVFHRPGQNTRSLTQSPCHCHCSVTQCHFVKFVHAVQ